MTVEYFDNFAMNFLVIFFSDKRKKKLFIISLQINIHIYIHICKYHVVLYTIYYCLCIGNILVVNFYFKTIL